MWSTAKRAAPYVRQYGKYHTKKHKKPVHRIAKRAADWFEKITGFGDYTVSRNTLLTDNPPAMFQQSGQGIRVTHREYLGDLYGSTGFDIDSFVINPGDRRSFPWLSQIAQNFEQYCVNGMVFEFRSTSGDAVSSTNNALGTVIMSTEYDVYDNLFSNKQEMCQNMFTCSGTPSKNLLHPVECDPESLPTKNLYIRHSDDTADRDLRFMDLGRFAIATQGMQAANINLGELWVSYDIQLFKAQPSALSPIMYAANCGVGSSNTNIFGTAPEIAEAKSSQYISVLNDTITFQPALNGKKFQVIFWAIGSTVAYTEPGAVAVNCSLGSIGLGMDQAPSNGTSANRVMSSLVVELDGQVDSVATLVFSGAVLPVSVLNVDKAIFISEVPS